MLPPLQPPPKPAVPEGLGALETIALSPGRVPGKVFLRTSEFVVAYDAYRKSAVHLLILPRVPICGPSVLDASHAPMLRRMARLAPTP